MSSKGQAAGEAMAVEPPAARDPSRTSDEGILARFCMLPLKDFLLWDSWITWEHELRRAQAGQGMGIPGNEAATPKCDG